MWQYIFVQYHDPLCFGQTEGWKLYPVYQKALIVCTSSGDKQEFYKQVDKLCFPERIVQIMGFVCVTFCIKQLTLKLYIEIMVGHSNNNLL